MEDRRALLRQRLEMLRHFKVTHPEATCTIEAWIQETKRELKSLDFGREG